MEAVAGVSFAIRRGEFVAILGPSGCGKSTLLMMCAGLESITSGTISVDGAPMAGPRTSIGVMFQESTLLPWKSVLDNVMFPIELLHRPRKEHMARARELISLVGRNGFESHKPHPLSGGMRQRAAICRALLTEPQLLLMDEPFGALDAMTRDDLNVELTRIWQTARRTVLFVTHSITEAIFLSDRVVVMSPSPGRVREIVSIELARPRPLAVQGTPEFAAYVTHLRGVFAELGVAKG